MMPTPDFIPEGFDADQGTIEPSSAQRQVARELRGLFLALAAEGFSEEQATAISATAFAALVSGRVAGSEGS